MFSDIFGVDVHRCRETGNVYCSQADYLRQLSPITIDRPRGSGRTLESKITPEETTLYRSLVSAIAWLGVTFPPALACASLYQGFLPTPTIAQVNMLNACLLQFKELYTPLTFQAGLTNQWLIAIADSSLGNVSKYSQGGFVVLLFSQNSDYVCGRCSILSFRSSKSKRVAASTFHAETLALVAAIEETALIQTFLYEIRHPEATAIEMLNVPPSELIQVIGLTDCHDVLDTLCKSTMPVLSNTALTLYTSVLREFKSSGQVSQWGWLDTRDNLANCLTKIESNGTLDISPLIKLLRHGAWEPVFPYRWGLQLCDPSPLTSAEIKFPEFQPASKDKKTTVGELPA